jgi:two-component system, sensor histidine kinase PdtaS
MLARARLAAAPLVARLSTSVKMLAIMTLALLPLGILALLASLQTTRQADASRNADLRVAINEATRKLGNELTADTIAVRQSLAQIDALQPAQEACNRAFATVAGRRDRPVEVALFGSVSEAVCANTRALSTRPANNFAREIRYRFEGNSLVAVIPGQTGNSVALLRYPARTLAAFARPSGYNANYRLALENGGATLPLIDQARGADDARLDVMSSPLGIDGLTLSMDADTSSFSAPEALLTFLPLVMVASAALIGFLLADRLLIRPLERLRAVVARYQRGMPVPKVPGATPAVEIRELGNAFAQFANRLAEREHELEDAFEGQVRLTREVHHRVKNNLQVIASLINLHARDAESDAVASAYAAIARRVDALAIVHRNHFADVASGINVRTLLGELATNFRASFAAPQRSPAVALSSDILDVDQDTATPLAFMFTELAELSQWISADAAIGVEVKATAPSLARLSIRSDAFTDALFDGKGAATTMRIVGGLARQLRAELVRDGAEGSYTIAFPTLKK